DHAGRAPRLRLPRGRRAGDEPALADRVPERIPGRGLRDPRDASHARAGREPAEHVPDHRARPRPVPLTFGRRAPASSAIPPRASSARGNVTPAPDRRAGKEDVPPSATAWSPKETSRADWNLS